MGNWWLSYWDDYRWFSSSFFLILKLLRVSSDLACVIYRTKTTTNTAAFVVWKITFQRRDLKLSFADLVRRKTWYFPHWFVDTAESNEKVRERCLTDRAPGVRVHMLALSPATPLLGAQGASRTEDIFQLEESDDFAYGTTCKSRS